MLYIKNLSVSWRELKRDLKECMKTLYYTGSIPEEKAWKPPTFSFWSSLLVQKSYGTEKSKDWSFYKFTGISSKEWSSEDFLSKGRKNILGMPLPPPPK